MGGPIQEPGRGVRGSLVLDLEAYDEGMSDGKKRVTLTLDPELLDSAEAAVEAGEARSVSSWVNAALAERKRRQDRARMLIKQDAADAQAQSPEEYERALAWARSITGNSAAEASA